MSEKQSAAPTVDATSWRALKLFARYRLFLSAVLFAVFFFELPPDYLGAHAPTLYQQISLFYLVTAGLIQLFTERQWVDYELLTTFQLLVDVVLLTLLIHTSGGLQTGMGSLLVVVVVAGGSLVSARLSAFIAAIATLAVLIEATLSQIVGEGVMRFSQAGVLGAAFFATALLAQILSRKMQRSQQLADERAVDVSKLAQLNQLIIRRLDVGVLVLDADEWVTLSNDSAAEMLGLSAPSSGWLLSEKAPMLKRQLDRWRQSPEATFDSVQIRPDLPAFQVRATALDSGETLVYLENASLLAQQAQQLKLASLGRLTASIAHEIRNPLGAISHAGELLSESMPANNNQRKLTDIIQRHSSRVNTIVDNVLQMSRRRTTTRRRIELGEWLAKGVADFTEQRQIPAGQMQLHLPERQCIWVNGDASQLHQVLENLLENAWHYAKSENSPAVTVSLSHESEEVLISVTDNGPGASDKAIKHMFEPFFSERREGTGLGLYLARELCEANGARLNYVNSTMGGRFEIRMPLSEEVTHT